MPIAELTKFQKTYCSQCGAEFGPGNSGYSHCQDHRKAPTLRIAFQDLLTNIANNTPPRVMANADADDIEDRADHLQRFLKDVETYVAHLLQDTAQCTRAVKLDVDVLGILSDTQGDLVGTLKIAAEQMRRIRAEV